MRRRQGRIGGRRGRGACAVSFVIRHSSFGDASGSALIVVLWVVGLLSLLIASMAFDAHVEARIISYYRKRSKAESLARSGIEVANMLLAKRAEIQSPDQQAPEGDRWFEPARQLRKGAIRGLTESLGEGTITLDIVPEPARRNINNLDVQGNRNETEVTENLVNVLEVGGITEDMNRWPQLVDSFLDWIDTDDRPRPDGAETDDYYGTLEPPYRAANRPLETVEELLLVKGFNRTILFGGTIQPALEGEEPRSVSGIADLLTVYGDGKVNINSASQRVLMTLPGVDEVIAGAIIEEREGWVDQAGQRQDAHYQNEDELFRRIPDLDAARVRRYITTADSAICRVTAVGEVHGVRRTVWCIAEYGGGRLNIIQWWEGD
jgi:general secretion pathway protein K